MSHPDVLSIIRKIWDETTPIMIAIDNFQKDVSLWNHSIFGNIFTQKKKKLVGRLEGIQKSPIYPHSRFLINLEQKLTKKFNIILKIEEEFGDSNLW